MLLFYNEDAFITLIILWVYNSNGTSIYCHPSYNAMYCDEQSLVLYHELNAILMHEKS